MSRTLQCTNRRIMNDITKLNKKKYEVKSNSDTEDIHYWLITLIGPIDSPYFGYKYVISLEFPKSYPFKSPSVVFKTKIFHPNISDNGAVCISALNTDWTPAYSIDIIFDAIIPHLLVTPNCDDPFNSSAASLYTKDRNTYNKKVQQYNEKYAVKIGKTKPEKPELKEKMDEDDEPESEDDEPESDELSELEDDEPESDELSEPESDE